jgi:hypothetical protein
MIEKTFTYNDATITCKRATVRSRLQAQWLVANLEAATATVYDIHMLTPFVGFLTQCTVKGNLGFTIPGVSANKKELEKGLDAFLSQDVEFYDLLVDALNEVDAVLSKKK